MFTLRRPDPSAIRAFRQAQSRLPFSYAEVGATRASPPAGWDFDHGRVEIGRDDAAWERAKAALSAWTMFDIGWVELHPLERSDAPIEVGTTVALLVKKFGLWSLNAARIVYVIDEPLRFGFAYGTLPDHVERGEELFQVERTSDGLVFYDVQAFSQPNALVARLAKPWMRRWQKRFGIDSRRAMLRAARGVAPDGS